MNKTYLAMFVLELNLDDWEPIIIEKTYLIRDRKTGIIVGRGPNLVHSILNARTNALKMF